ncbi:TIGR03943 family protein [Luteolibacter flavescens]|uniref:TIGR03943 family protein n=1 Tax=Luteolibacter flavescens TaxID=1859460 RepID=A0ABT3FKV2_9BACT|nr:TIGR03943 family protein [Luteolibacter flavescens]MCW1884077.1 TIGR03943 family protein [Luteolibacter flavescens]
MNPKIQRVLFSIALLVWAAVLIYFYASGRIVKYLAPDFRPLVMAGGLGLGVVGLFNLLTATQEASCGHDHGPDDAHDHESMDVHPLAAFLILLLPLGLGVSWTKDAFSLGSLTRKGLMDTPADASSLIMGALPPLTKELIEKQHPKNADGYHTFGLMELFFSAGDPEMRELVGGMQVETEGRVIQDPDAVVPNQRRLYRLFITCCAADSRAIPIIVRFKGEVPQVEDNTWMKLAGTMRYPDEGEGNVPVLEVDTAAEAPPPAEESFMRSNF